jgi:hypothetical protein
MTFPSTKGNAAPRRFDDLPNAQQAGMLCNDKQFQKFADTQTAQWGTELSPTATAEFIRNFCDVDSRRDLNANPVAATKFQTLRTEFDAWAGHIQSPR